MINVFVIIPVYNAAPFLLNAVASVNEQDRNNTRIILVNDGSTDGSGVLCNELTQKYSNVVAIHQDNKGVSAARNAGIEYALRVADDVDYLAFLDADDYWHPDFINRSQQLLTNEHHDIFAFGMITCNENATKFSSPTSYSPHTIVGGHNAIWNITNHFAANFYKVSLFKKWNIRFFEGYKYSQDKYFRMQCCFFAESISFENIALYVYRDNSTGAMRKSKKYQLLIIICL